MKSLIIPVLLLHISWIFPPPTLGQGNGNYLAIRTTPYDEVVPIPHNKPPFYIRERIVTFVEYFFDQPEDMAQAEATLMMIWYYNKVYNMLELVDRMKRKQYAYAEYEDECVGDSNDDPAFAIAIQREIEDTMHKPEFIHANDHFFDVESWWEIVGNTVDNIWNKNQLIARKVCDFRRRGLLCLNGTSNDVLRCACARARNGERMVATKGGICGIEKDKACNYSSASRLMRDVYDMEVYNTISDNHLIFQTCFGNSFCTRDLSDNNTKCQCWPLITSETRAKRNVLLNYTIGGSRCDQILEGRIIKWGKWYVALTIVWITLPLILVLAPHWDDICLRIVPGYYKHARLGDRSEGLPGKLERETYDVKMAEETKRFIEENALVLDVEDPDYFDKVDAVDDRELDPLERFVLVPHCTDKSYHFEWPTVNKLRVWF